MKGAVGEVMTSCPHGLCCLLTRSESHVDTCPIGRSRRGMGGVGGVWVVKTLSWCGEAFLWCETTVLRNVLRVVHWLVSLSLLGV